MQAQVIDEYRLISIKQLVKAVREGKDNSERFCFIIGAGASVSSGIPAGVTLECDWMREMEEWPGLDEMRGIAERLRERKRLEHDFEEIEAAWEETKKSGEPLPSKYYFDIYKLRFFPNHRNGYYYLEKVMADKKPGFGYHPLALMLTEGSGNNLVITTNFDSLVEDALFLYTDSKPLVINHELLADYAGDSNIKRPIIAKVHRGIFFDPLNQPEDTNELKGRWRDVLVSVFQSYTPIVIGYGGGDNSLMNLLEEDNVRMKNGLYWCYMEKYGLPDQKIQKLVQEKKGYFVRTAGFDATMLALGNALFPEKIGIHEAEEYLNNRTSMHITNYEKEYKRLTGGEGEDHAANSDGPSNESEDEFRKDIEKITERGTVSEQERQKMDQMTAWDYWRRGMRHYELEQYGKAVESFSCAIEKQANVAQFYSERGISYYALRQYEKSIAENDRAIELNPEFEVAYNNRGYAYAKMGEYRKAIADFNKAIALKREYDTAYHGRGYAYDRLGEWKEALQDYNRAIDINPKYAAAYRDRAGLYARLSYTYDAMEDLNSAIALYPENAASYTDRGSVYMTLGNYKQAIADFNKAVALKPGAPKPYEERAKAYRLLGDEEAAKADEARAQSLREA